MDHTCWSRRHHLHHFYRLPDGGKIRLLGSGGVWAADNMVSHSDRPASVCVCVRVLCVCVSSIVLLSHAHVWWWCVVQQAWCLMWCTVQFLSLWLERKLLKINSCTLLFEAAVQSATRGCSKSRALMCFQEWKDVCKCLYLCVCVFVCFLSIYSLCCLDVVLHCDVLSCG